MMGLLPLAAPDELAQADPPRPSEAVYCEDMEYEYDEASDKVHGMSCASMHFFTAEQVAPASHCARGPSSAAPRVAGHAHTVSLLDCGLWTAHCVAAGWTVAGLLEWLAVGSTARLLDCACACTCTCTCTGLHARVYMYMSE